MMTLKKFALNKDEPTVRQKSTILSLKASLILIVSLWAVTLQAQDTRITCNNAAFGGGPINTYNVPPGGAPAASFVPTGAFDSNNGRGVQVVGNRVYYTELSGGFGPTDFIRRAPFSGGAGGPDQPPCPNPRPGTGVQDIAFHNGVLYVMTGYPSTSPVEVFGLDPTSCAVVSGPVVLLIPGGGVFPGTSADGFTVTPDGNFLANDGDVQCTYRKYLPTGGPPIAGSAITVPGGGTCTGVDTDGAFLYFQHNFNSFTKTTLFGALVSTTGVAPNLCEDISVVTPGCSRGVPGEPDCHGKCVSELARRYGGIENASDLLGYASVDALQDAITAFCGS